MYLKISLVTEFPFNLNPILKYNTYIINIDGNENKEEVFWFEKCKKYLVN